MRDTKTIWHNAAYKMGMDRDELERLCEAGLVLDAEKRGGMNDDEYWWCPDPPTILKVEDKIGVRCPMPKGMEPLVLTARRSGLEPSAVTRLCRNGGVRRARKEHGQWFLPIGTVVDKPRMGRPTPVIPDDPLPDWLKTPVE